MMTACPDKSLLLQAHVDDELDAANEVVLEAHLRSCAGCAEELARLEALRAMLAGEALGHRAPSALRAQIESLVDGGTASVPVPRATPAAMGRPMRWPGGSGLRLGNNWSTGMLMGLAASVALVLAVPQITRTDTEDQLIASHIRSLSLDSHLTDVATSDRHVVKPWFNGKIDFAPPVPELASQGFPLVGGRLDYLGRREVAAIVYKRRLHTINVFVEPAGTLSPPGGIATRRDGYSLVRWTDGGLEFWAVSDIDLGELEVFRHIFTGQPSL